jgi:hypothetical protein
MLVDDYYDFCGDPAIINAISDVVINFATLFASLPIVWNQKFTRTETFAQSIVLLMGSLHVNAMLKIYTKS